MVSTLSADGILTVEAPVPESSVPAFTIIPIKVIGNNSFEEDTGSFAVRLFCSFRFYNELYERGMMLADVE